MLNFVGCFKVQRNTSKSMVRYGMDIKYYGLIQLAYAVTHPTRYFVYK
jgi:hypothetical protein